MVDKIVGSAPIAPAPTSTGPARSFDQILDGVKAGGAAARPTGAAAASAQPPAAEGPAPAERAQAAAVTDAAGRPAAVRLVRAVAEAQRRLDRILKMAESGKAFSPAELLAFQAHAYRASQEIDLASKVVEKGTAAVKQTLQTQV